MLARPPERRRDEREVAAERRDDSAIAVLARDPLVVVQRAVELERLDKPAERGGVDRVGAFDHLAAAEVAADRVDDRLPGLFPAHASAPSSFRCAIRAPS
jgi:hypothetical protein